MKWHIRSIASICAILLVSASTGLGIGCSVPTGRFDVIRVEGTVTVRGNVPFNAPILETDSRNFYVLVLTPDQARSMMTPARFRVSGRLYLDDWNGRPYAHIEVSTLSPIER